MGCRSFSGRVSGLTGRPSRKACQGVRPLVVVAQEEGIKRGLQVDLADPLQHPDEERVDRDQGTGVRSFDVALTELGCHPVGMRTLHPRFSHVLLYQDHLRKWAGLRTMFLCRQTHV